MNRPVDLLFDTLDFSLRVISYVYLRIFYYAIAGCFCSCFCLIFYPLANASHASRVTCPSPARRDLTRATCSFVFKPLPKHSLLRTLEFYDIEYNALSPVPYRHTLGGVPPQDLLLSSTNLSPPNPSLTHRSVGRPDRTCTVRGRRSILVVERG